MEETIGVIKEILLKGNYVSAEDLAQAEKVAGQNSEELVNYLTHQELINKDLFGQALSEYYKVEYADLNSNLPELIQILKIPEATAKKYRLVLYKETPKINIITSDQPKQAGLDKICAELFPAKKVTFAYSLTEDIDAVLLNYRQKLETRFAQILKKDKKIAPEIIDEIISDALDFRASDIHFEPQETNVLIRFRVDGRLEEAGQVNLQTYENILNLIKVKANIRIDEHATAQDGAIRLENKGNAVDVRVSIVPTLNGEKVVFRLLSKYVSGFTLNDLGLAQQDQELLKAASARPFGMILVVGPTGSGKSTTLYSVLRGLNDPKVNITTIEDPVEYKMKLANQIQVNSRTGLTFAKGLRSIVRQDPDIILVGEIRDHETAEIAVNAALTGHLLLSTFHANDAATTIPRLFDMGIEPFLLSSTLELIIAQRLVRKVCEHCRYSYKEIFNFSAATQKALRNYFPKTSVTLYRGKGCPACNHTGYKGRTAIFEFMHISPELKELILRRPSAPEIWRLAQTQGAHTFFSDGIEKVKNGITSLEELIRVAPPENN